tara:strand:- start:803 stop:1126 length:324 start_codon:yes stop_codon:yes gene_type:complete
MIKKTDWQHSGTSFHNVTITTSTNRLAEVLGPPSHRDPGDGKVTREWALEYIDPSDPVGEAPKRFVTVYDWKEGWDFPDNMTVRFHIGARSLHESMRAKELLISKLK